MARVALEHVDKVYPGGTRALSDCTLAVEDGELAVIVGPSGCGKSTVLRIVAGLESVTAGTVRIGDRVANNLPPQERNAAMVFQDYALYPYLTARGNLEFPLRMRRLARAAIRDRVEAIARLLDITGLLDRLPKQLSGGQRQRVAMGRALVREPAVFLLDEPLSNLDAKLRVQVRAEIKELQTRTRTTMMYVTHDQTEAMTLGDRVVVLDRGRLQQVAPPAELYARPANTFVAGFIGNPPMNLVPAQAIPIGARDAAVTAGVRPEAIDIVADGGIPATVEHVEYLGHETLVHVRIGVDVRLIARVPGMRTLAPDAPVAVRIAPARVHLFDADGRALGS
ncbi:MAG TPA: ABC transporter ATP-binding protein [Candidatus Binatia bacterium]|nr:ABC transporter ATP-binding protein [Candidatus Binatia bacterium]